MCMLGVSVFVCVICRQEIETLEKEQEELQRSLCVSESLSRRQRDSEDAQTLRSMLEQRDEVGDEVERERQSQAELEQEVQEVHTHAQPHTHRTFTPLVS